MINVVIDKNSPTLEEALNRINYPHRVIEFQTFVREGAETVRAHFFEPLYQVAAPEKITKTGLTNEALTTTHKIGEYVTIKDLIDSSILKVGQIFYRRYKGQRYECKVLNDGGIELIHTGTKFPSINATTNAVTGTAWDAWYFWRTTRENGTECQLEELRKEYRAAHP